jgi:hypothetical protein
MDQRIDQAQKLFWEVSRLRESGLHRLAVRKLVQMAAVHEARAMELLRTAQADGWADLYAAVTAWGDAGHRNEANALIEQGRELLTLFPDGTQNIEQQLNELGAWLESLRVVPSLGDFARPLPAIPVEAA